MSTPEELGSIVLRFLYFRDQLKIYHWQTHRYSDHKTLDKLIDVFTLKIDEFVEVIQGSRGFRLKLPKKSSVKYCDEKDLSIEKLLINMRKYILFFLSDILKKEDVGLKNIVEEMVGVVNRYNYLFSLS